MKLKNLQKHWDAWAKKDAMWAILTEPLLANNAWDSATFFETGREDIRQAFAELDKRHITLRHNSALDFGCGIGRLTQALAPFFKNTHGVDISSSMIEQADKHNQFKNSCFYHVNCEDNLKMFRDNEFDFIYSHIALQHTSSASQISYLKEFARLLAPGGVILIQLIEFRSLLRFCPPFVYELYRRLRYLGRTRMDMNGVNRNQVKAVLTSHGLNVLDIQVIEQQRWWLSLRYYATKKVD